MIMVEPWVSPWSSWVYKTFHHEPFDPKTKKWTFTLKGPLSGAKWCIALDSISAGSRKIYWEIQTIIVTERFTDHASALFIFWWSLHASTNS